MDSTLQRAAELLSQARLPVFGGLFTDVNGATAALALAQKLGGVVDHAASDGISRAARVMRETGSTPASFGEVRNRADTVVLIGDGPRERDPDLLEKLFPSENLPRPGDNKRELIVIGTKKGKTPSGVRTTEVNGNSVSVTTSATKPADAMCAQVLTPFEEVIPLDVGDLEAGEYTVEVNGVRTSFTVGEEATLTKTVTDEDIATFARISGDINPIHLDDDYARSTRFGNRIAHGTLVAGLISAVLGTKLPGPGAIYLSQDLRFKAPVRPGDTVTARAQVTAWDGGRGRVTLETDVRNEEGTVVIKDKTVSVVEG